MPEPSEEASGSGSTRFFGQRGSVWHGLILLLLALPILFYGLGSYSVVNGDEGFYQAVAGNMVRTGNWLRLEFTGEHRFFETLNNAPLHYWARAVLIALLGDSYWTMRLLSACFALLGVGLTYLFACHLASRRAALFAALLQLSTWQFVYLHSARTGEMEPIVAFLFTLSAWLFIRALETGRSFVGPHLCLMVLMNVKLPVFVMPLLAQFAYLVLSKRSRHRMAEWVLLAVFLLPLGLIWHVVQGLIHQTELLAVVKEMLSQAGGTASRMDWELYGTPLQNVWYYGQVLVFGAFPMVLLYPFGAVSGFWVRPAEGRTDAYLLVVLYVAAVLLFFVFVSKHYSWYVIPAYPFLSLLAGAWLDRLGSSGRGYFEVLALAIVLGLVIWIEVPLIALDPFSERAAAYAMPVSWRDLGGGGGLSGPVGAVLVLVVLMGWLRRGFPAGFRRFAPIGVFAVFCGIGLLRVGTSLEHVEKTSEMERLARELREAESSGRPVHEPIEVWEGGYLRARYYFGDRYRIVRRPGRLTGVHFHLYANRGDADKSGRFP